ncbi:hypothetical protein vseg_021650 [Gypsophila vaccaria]
MASIETSDNAEKAEVEELMSTEFAKSVVVEAERQNQPTVIAQVGNSRGTLQLLATVNWTGSFFTAPPRSVGAGEIIRFSHNGSKGALIYGQQGSSNAAAYLLAWYKGRGFYERRVYVKCGPVSEVYYNGWERAALTSLDNARGYNSSDKHEGTSSSVEARINDATGTFPLGTIVARLN